MRLQKDRTGSEPMLTFDNSPRMLTASNAVALGKHMCGYAATTAL